MLIDDSLYLGEGVDVDAACDLWCRERLFSDVQMESFRLDDWEEARE